VGLAAFVETLPSSGAAGISIMILGNNLTGAPTVNFNATAAAFTVVSSTEIFATVPAGATSFTVEVTTPAGTLNSNVPFQITPP
jgi:large repetitive protein